MNETLRPRPEHPFFARVIVVAGYKHITGRTASWPALEARLRLYELEPLTIILARIAAAIDSEDFTFERVQRTLSATFLPSIGGERAFERVTLEFSRRGNRAAIFHVEQVLNLIKVAFRVLPVTTSYRDPVDLAPLGEALLMMSDLLNESRSRPAEGEWWPLYRNVFATGLLYAKQNRLHALARSYDIYLKDRPHLKSRPDYVHMPSLVRRSLGVDPETLWLIYFALFSSTMNRTGSGDPFPRLLQRSHYLSGNFDFSAEEVDRFLEPLVVQASELKVQLSRFRRDSLDPLNFQAFLERPFVQFGDRLVPVAPDLVAEKLGRGLHFIGMNQSQFSGKEIESYLRYVGDVFEDDVHRQFEYIYGTRYVRLEPHRGNHDGGLADGLVLLDNAVVVVEIKAKLFTAGIRFGTRQDQLDRKLDETILRAARQIQQTIDVLRRRKLPLSLELPRRWFPLVVTLERSFLRCTMPCLFEFKRTSISLVTISHRTKFSI